MTNQEYVAIAVGLLAPILVGLVTKTSQSAGLKAVLLAAIAAVTGIGQGFLNTPPETTWVWQTAVLAGGVAWVTAVATHYGLYKPTGITATIQGSVIKDAV